MHRLVDRRNDVFHTDADSLERPATDTFARVTDDGFRADGAFGQFCIVMPKQDAVIAITAESFDKQVAHKMGEFFNKVFFPSMKKLVEAGKSYEEVKRLVEIPSTWGAKISGEQFRDRVAEFM